MGEALLCLLQDRAELGSPVLDRGSRHNYSRFSFLVGRRG